MSVHGNRTESKVMIGVRSNCVSTVVSGANQTAPGVAASPRNCPGRPGLSGLAREGSLLVVQNLETLQTLALLVEVALRAATKKIPMTADLKAVGPVPSVRDSCPSTLAILDVAMHLRRAQASLAEERLGLGGKTVESSLVQKVDSSSASRAMPTHLRP
jgi:hypothetical protein